MLTTRARRAVLAVVGTCPMEGSLHQREASFLGARPCFNVPAADCNERPAFAWRVTALAVYAEEAQHARLRRPRAMPRWLGRYMP